MIQQKNGRVDDLEYRMAVYDDLFAGRDLAPEVRRLLDPEVYVDTKKIMKRIRTEVEEEEDQE